MDASPSSSSKLEGSFLGLKLVDVQEGSEGTANGHTNGYAAELTPKATKSAKQLKAELNELTEVLDDIQTSLYAIQEQRHATTTSPPPDASTTIDHLLQTFDTSLEIFSHRISHLTDAINGYFSSSVRGTTAAEQRDERELQRRLGELQGDWADVVGKDELLREELKEDRWLVVFRTAADQAEGMMDSLQKAVSQCTTLAYKVMSSNTQSDSQQVESTITNYEAKKKFYHPSVTKSLTILDKGINERITSNGEVLRRQNEMSDRWKTLKEEMTLIDKQIPDIRYKLAHPSSSGSTEHLLDDPASSDHGSGKRTYRPSSKQTTPRGYTATEMSARAFLASPPASPTRETIARPVMGQRVTSPGPAGSAFSKVLKKATSSFRTHTPSSSDSSALAGPSSISSVPPSPRSDAGSTSYFGMLRRKVDSNASSESPRMVPPKPKWNASPKSVDYADAFNSSSPFKMRRSVSKSGLSDAGSRGASPSPSIGSSRMGALVETPRRPSGEMYYLSPQSKGIGLPEGRNGRPSSPAFSSVSSAATGTSKQRSGIPVALRSASSPLINNKSSTPSMRAVSSGHAPPVPALPSGPDLQAKEARLAYLRSTMQTPEPMLRERATQMPFYAGRQSTPLLTPSRLASHNGETGIHTTPTNRARSVSGTTVMSGRRTPSGMRPSGPPSSFKDPTRSPSAMGLARSGAATPAPFMGDRTGFTPNKLDELDMELAHILETIPNDIVVERVDPPLRRGQRHEGEWTSAYAFTSGRSGRKVYQCRLLVLNKPGSAADGKSRKVMIRIGGIWVDLRLHILKLA